MLTGHHSGGMCTVYFSLVDVLYWPVPGANTACLDNATSLDSVPISSPALVSSRNDTVSTTVGPDGFTYTSPSIYVAYHDISASNRCGQIGPKHTSITLSFAPGSLSTSDYAPGIFAGPYGGQPKPLNLSDLPCPPQSLLDAQESANQVGFSLPARPGYAPIIAPPPALQNLEPAWKNCHSQFAFDPPRSLVPASALVPSPTPANQAGPELTPAMPSPSTEAPPAQTQLGKGPIAVDPSSSGDVTPDLPNAVDPPNHNEPATDGKQGNAPDPETSVVDLPLQPETEQNGHESSAVPNQHNSGNNGLIEPVPNLSFIEIGRQTFTALPSGGFAVADTTLQANGPAVTVQGVSASLGSAQIVFGSSTVLLPTGSANSVLIAAGQTFTPLGRGTILVNGNTLSVNGPPTTASGTVLSLVSSGFIVDSQTIAFPTPGPDLVPNANGIVTFADQTFTRLGSGDVAFNGMTLVANGPAATVSGTVISLASASLVIGSQILTFPTPAPDLITNANAIVTVAGQTFTRHGSDAVAFNGMTLIANGPAATVSGTVMSLASSSLVIGSQTFAFPASALGALPNAVVIDGNTLTAGGLAVTISGTTLSLAFGGSGLYVAGHGSDASSFSVPMTAGEIASLDAEGRLVVDGSSVTGDLGSVIMLGFGPADKASKASVTGNGVITTAEPSSNVTTGVLGFTGEGTRCFNLHIVAVVGLAFCINLFSFQ